MPQAKSSPSFRIWQNSSHYNLPSFSLKLGTQSGAWIWTGHYSWNAVTFLEITLLDTHSALCKFFPVLPGRSLVYLSRLAVHACSAVCSVMSSSSRPPRTAAYQVPLFMEFSSRGAGYHYLLQGIFLTQGLNLCLLCLLHWQVDSLPLCHPGGAQMQGQEHLLILWSQRAAGGL